MTVDVPDNVTIGDRPADLRPGVVADYEALPQIAQIWLSGSRLERGGVWAGAVMTSSNVASVEIRTDTFSFSVPRTHAGDFEFLYDIPDLPPYLRRQFALRVIARNAAGDREEEDIPIQIR